MPGIGRDDARAGDLRVEARRAHKIAAEEDGETAHGEALYHAPRAKRKAQCRVCANNGLRGRRLGHYF